MNPSINIEIRRALEWLTFEYAKNPREMTKKRMKERGETVKRDEKYIKKIMHTKTIKNGDGESDYKAARDDFDSQIAVWMKM